MGRMHTLSATLVEARSALLMELGAGCGTASIQQVRDCKSVTLSSALAMCHEHCSSHAHNQCCCPAATLLSCKWFGTLVATSGGQILCSHLALWGTLFRLSINVMACSLCVIR